MIFIKKIMIYIHPGVSVGGSSTFVRKKFFVAAGHGQRTNNRCESINHILRYTVHLANLMEKLWQLVDSQKVNADHALIDRGKFIIKATHAKHHMTADDWSHMSQVSKFLNGTE